jgi:hypothetical protein
MTNKDEDPGRRAQRRDATGQLVERQASAARPGVSDPAARWAAVVHDRRRSWEGCDRRKPSGAPALFSPRHVSAVEDSQERERERESARLPHARPLFAPFAQTWLAERIALGGRTGPGCPALAPRISSGALVTWRLGSAEWGST